LNAYERLLETSNALLAPELAGDDVRNSERYQSVHSLVGDLRNADAAFVERKSDDAAPQNKWRSVLGSIDDPDSPGALSVLSESKNIDVAVWVVECWVREHGFDGFAAGLSLLDGLLARYGESLHPQSPGRLERTLGVIDRDTQVSHFGMPLMFTPLTNAPEGLYTYRDVLGFHSNATPLGPLGGPGAPLNDQEMLRMAAARTSPAFVESSRAGLRRSADALESLAQRISETVPSAPRWGGKLLGLVKRIEAELDALVPAAGQSLVEEQVVDEPASASASAEGVRSATVSGVSSRAEAIRLIDAVAAYFERTEPSSPVSDLLRRAAGWGATPFADLWREMNADDRTRDAVSWLIKHDDTTDNQT
jgi:type VI secretion system protein ImpA